MHARSRNHIHIFALQHKQNLFYSLDAFYERMCGNVFFSRSLFSFHHMESDCGFFVMFAQHQPKWFWCTSAMWKGTIITFSHWQHECTNILLNPINHFFFTRSLVNSLFFQHKTQKQTKRMRNQRMKTNVRSRREKTASTRTIDINFWKILWRETFHNNSSCCFFLTVYLLMIQSNRYSQIQTQIQSPQNHSIKIKKTPIIDFKLNTQFQWSKKWLDQCRLWSIRM